jgi:uncharacterized protein (DUF4415 family)
MAGKGANKIAVNLKIDRDLIEKVRSLAIDQGRTYSGEVERALRSHVAASGKRRRKVSRPAAPVASAV